MHTHPAALLFLFPAVGESRFHFGFLLFTLSGGRGLALLHQFIDLAFEILALKIRYASIVEWYNFWSIVLQHHQNIVPTVASIDETIRHITEGNRSISRFGDGEMLLTSPSKSIGFQEGSPLLAKRLREVLVSHEEGHLVAIPDVFSGLNRYRRKCRRFQRTHFFIYGKWWDQLLIPGRKYENAFLSRPYMDYTSKEHCARWFRELKTIWEGRDIVFIEGAMSRLGVGNDANGERDYRR